ncbi:MAG: hypothetical protein R6W90_13975 [Ignavibacteriaceae bacterium]
MNTFKYNLTFYYQSTIIYFVVFILYILILGEFVEDYFTLIIRDPIIYFFGIIVLISLAGLFYNLYKRKSLEVNESGISFVSRFGRKSFSVNEIVWIKLSKERRLKQPLRLIRIKLKHRRRPILIRPNNYENEPELVKRFRELKEKVEALNHV